LKDIEELGALGTLADYERAIKLAKNKTEQDTIYKEGTNVKLHLVEFASLIKLTPEDHSLPKLTQGVVEAYEECIVRYKNQNFQDGLM